MKGGGRGGRGDEYARFIIDPCKPYKMVSMFKGTNPEAAKG
jgi:hypothetical protein